MYNNNSKTDAIVYSEISPYLREILLRYTIDEISRLDPSQFTKEDVLKVFETLNYSKYIIHDFHAVIADPPWPYRNVKAGGSFNSAAEQKYDTMKVEKLKKIGPILKDLTGCNTSKKDLKSGHGSLLFLWVTTNFQEEAMDLIESWGYKYKTKLYWIKPSMGMGYWFRNRVEELWVCVSAKYENRIKAFHFQYPNTIEEDAKQHSAKPFIRPMVNEAVTRSFDSGHYSKLELFANKNQLEDLRMNGDITDNMEWKLHGHTIDNNKDIVEVLIDNYYSVPLRNFARMRLYEGWRPLTQDIEFLRVLLDDSVNKSKRQVMVRTDFASRKNMVEPISIQTK